MNPNETRKGLCSSLSNPNGILAQPFMTQWLAVVWILHALMSACRSTALAICLLSGLATRATQQQKKKRHQELFPRHRSAMGLATRPFHHAAWKV